MARKRYRARRRCAFYGPRKHAQRKIPLLPIIGIIGTPAITFAISEVMQGRPQNAPTQLRGLVGIQPDGMFHLDTFLSNATPIAAGLAGHWLASKFGLNRAIAKFPLVNL